MNPKPTQTVLQGAKARGGSALLAKRAARGRERALAAIYRRHHQELYRYCRAILHSHEDAQDALQNTMLCALRALPKMERKLALRPWLFRIAHNESISLLRKRSARGLREADLDTIACAAANPSAAEALAARERLRELIADIRALPEHQRGALLMRELSGLSLAEIAAALQVSEGAVKQLIYEARAALLASEEGRAMGCEGVRELIGAGDRRTLRGRKVRAHLRSCAGCRALADSIATREAALQALFPPLPLALSAALLQRTLARAGGHSSSVASAGAGAGLAAGPIGAGHAGFALLAKALVAALLAAGAAVGGVELAGGGAHSGADRGQRRSALAGHRYSRAQTVARVRRLAQVRSRSLPGGRGGGLTRRVPTRAPLPATDPRSAPATVQMTAPAATPGELRSAHGGPRRGQPVHPAGGGRGQQGARRRARGRGAQSEAPASRGRAHRRAVEGSGAERGHAHSHGQVGAGSAPSPNQGEAVAEGHARSVGGGSGPQSEASGGRSSAGGGEHGP
jgi:RNA polymerase sigma factor (sigma-70 family)